MTFLEHGIKFEGKWLLDSEISQNFDKALEKEGLPPALVKLYSLRKISEVTMFHFWKDLEIPNAEKIGDENSSPKISIEVNLNLVDTRKKKQEERGKKDEGKREDRGDPVMIIASSDSASSSRFDHFKASSPSMDDLRSSKGGGGKGTGAGSPGAGGGGTTVRGEGGGGGGGMTREGGGDNGEYAKKLHLILLTYGNKTMELLADCKEYRNLDSEFFGPNVMYKCGVDKLGRLFVHFSGKFEFF
jgi:hypothetical protein